MLPSTAVTSAVRRAFLIWLSSNGDVWPRTLSIRWAHAIRLTTGAGRSCFAPTFGSGGRNCRASALVNHAKSWFQAVSRQSALAAFGCSAFGRSASRGMSREVTDSTRPSSG